MTVAEIGFKTVNSVAETLAPSGVVTERVAAPMGAPLGTVAVIWVLLSTLKTLSTPPKTTWVAPEKAVPVMTTEAPTGPRVGLKVMLAVGGGVGEGVPGTVKVVEERPVPPGVVMEMTLELAPLGTVAVIWVSLFTLKSGQSVLPKATWEAPVKAVPWITTEVPTGPRVGSNEVRLGAVEVAPVELFPPPPAQDNSPSVRGSRIKGRKNRTSLDTRNPRRFLKYTIGIAQGHHAVCQNRFDLMD